MAWMLWLYRALSIMNVAVMILAPLAVLSGFLAIFSIHLHRDRLLGTSLAVLAILIALTVSGGLITADVKVEQYHAQMHAQVERQFAPQEAQKRLEMCYHLLSECRRYADANRGTFPTDSLALKEWIAKDDQGKEYEVEPFEYFGANLKKSDLGDDEDGPHLIVFIGTELFADGTRVIGLLRGSSRWATDAKIIKDAELPQYISASNRARSNRRMPPMVFPQQ